MKAKFLVLGALATLTIIVAGCGRKTSPTATTGGLILVGSPVLPAGGVSTRVFGYAGTVNCLQVQAPLPGGQNYEIVCQEFTGTVDTMGFPTENRDHTYFRIVFDQAGVDSQTAANACFAILEPRTRAGQAFQVVGLRITDPAEPGQLVVHSPVDCTQ